MCCILQRVLHAVLKDELPHGSLLEEEKEELRRQICHCTRRSPHLRFIFAFSLLQSHAFADLERNATPQLSQAVNQRLISPRP